MNITSGSNPSISGEYFYIRNLQGDIIGLIDKNGTEVVSYTYDTWGKPISIEGSLKDTVGVKNPYRYRGYRYDTETGLYYLNSRYYNPEWGRFINADALGGEIGKLLSHNGFVYCMNNPVNMEDPTGNIAWWIIGSGIGAIVGGIAGAVYSYKKTGSVDWRYVAGGAAAGALIGAGVGYLAQAAYGAIVGASATAGSAAATVSNNLDKLSKAGQGVASNAANASRLNAQLTYQEASSVFTSSGLHPEVVDKSSKIIDGALLRNGRVIEALTADGSSISSWAKMSTQTFRSPSGNFQVHFYKNLENGMVSIFEMKVKFNK